MPGIGQGIVDTEMSKKESIDFIELLGFEHYGAYSIQTLISYNLTDD